VTDGTAGADIVQSAEGATFTELEETLIPYPDSFDLQRRNDTEYILRLRSGLGFERFIIESRISRFDNEDFSTLDSRLTSLVEWYHSTVYNINDELLEPETALVIDASAGPSGRIFAQLHANLAMVQEHLLYVDIYVLRGGWVYRYIGARNLLLSKMAASVADLAGAIPNRRDSFETAAEHIVLVARPKRSAMVHGERALVRSLVAAGELVQIIASILGSPMSTTKGRRYADVFDRQALAAIGVEGYDTVVASVFELHDQTTPEGGERV